MSIDDRVFMTAHRHSGHPLRLPKGVRFAVSVLLPALAVLAIAALVTVGGHRAGAPAPEPAARGSAPAVNAQVTLAPGAPVAIPRSFLGISTEYWTIPGWAQAPRVLHRVFAMLSSDGPIRLRIGGDSADRIRWAPVRELPEWAYELGGSWLRHTGQIVRSTHASLILDFNTVTATPTLAAHWAQAALRALPPHSVTAFEVGNEPDLYRRRAWQRVTKGSHLPPFPPRMTAALYAREYVRYARALSAAAPGVPLLAPALGIPQASYPWVSTLLHSPHPGLRGITIHRYPYGACARPGTASYPTVPKILSEHAVDSLGQIAHTVERISDPAGLPLWMTEFNSVTCGGVRGVSNTFATALWGPDALFELARSGIESASVHVRDNARPTSSPQPPAINMAFTLTRRGLTAYPLLYGMVMFARALGPGAQIVPVHLAAPRSLNLKAWVVRLSGHTMHILLINKGPRNAEVRLRLPVNGIPTAQRLSAPRVTATGQVTLGGQHLTRRGTWTGRRRSVTLIPTRSGPVLSVPPHSAALVTARVR